MTDPDAYYYQAVLWAAEQGITGGVGNNLFAPGRTLPYCLATFDSLIKRIVTMGASAGCYMIISIAEASVQEGGLPAMLRSAMSTRILFRPTQPEGLLLWDKVKLDPLPERIYGPGDAWFSSTDGLHDNVSYVHFPRMDFPVYRALGQLLTEYYRDSTAPTSGVPKHSALSRS